MLTGYEEVPRRLQMYVDYINNTGQVPLKVEWFDDDHDTVGPMVRADLQNGGFIYSAKDGGILLRPDLASQPNS